MKLEIDLGVAALHPFAAGGTRELYAVRNHESVRRFMSKPEPIPYRAHAAWVRAHLLGQDGLRLWLVRPAGGVRAVGFTQLRVAEDTAEIGVMFREPARHRLLAALATAATLHAAFDRFGVRRLVSYVLPAHRDALNFNLAWGASEEASDKAGMVRLTLDREACLANEAYRRVMSRLTRRMIIREA